MKGWGRNSDYSWEEDDETVRVHVVVEGEASGKDVDCVISPRKLFLKLRHRKLPLMEGTLKVRPLRETDMASDKPGEQRSVSVRISFGFCGPQGMPMTPKLLADNCTTDSRVPTRVDMSRASSELQDKRSLVRVRLYSSAI